MIMLKERKGKRKSQRETVVKRINAEAQEQENVFQKEERIINASVEEDMQEDTVKEVTYQHNSNKHKDTFPSADMPQKENQKISGRKWLQVKKTSFSETLQG